VSTHGGRFVMHRGWLVGALILAAVAAPAHADTYRWTDAEGNLHFTDDPARAARGSTEAGNGQAHTGRGGLAVASTSASQPAQDAAASLDASALAPAAGGPAEIRVRFELDGHLIRLRVRLNGQIEVPFYLDTGSSGIVLPTAVAARLGLATGPGAPQTILHTTAGPLHVPSVQLASVQVGGAEIRDLDATVSPNIEHGLLGGSFFRSFRYSIDPVSKVMVLRRVSSPN
jgi:clan AA aspartic protease (TIGR02281 family)